MSMERATEKRLQRLALERDIAVVLAEASVPWPHADYEAPYERGYHVMAPMDVDRALSGQGRSLVPMPTDDESLQLDMVQGLDGAWRLPEWHGAEPSDEALAEHASFPPTFETD